MEAKICTKCKKNLPFSEYSKQSKGKFGLHSRCRTCVKTYQKANKEKIAKSQKRYKQNNKEKIAEYQKEYQKEYYEANKERIAEYRKEYKQNNKALIYTNIAKRKATKLQAKPSWYSSYDENYFKLLQRACKILENHTLSKYHVDHIVPLKSDRVCGLHIAENFQILTAKENISKSNKILEKK